MPRPWTRPQAEHAEKRLRHLIAAIWQIHGEAMGVPRPATPAPGFIARLIPQGWTGPQALRAVHLLNAAIAAVWEVCEEDEELIRDLDEWTDGEDGIPF